MKLKYKKIILLTTMCTMGIGLLTLSLNHNQTDAKDNSESGKMTQEVMAEAENTSSEQKTDATNATTLSADNLTPTQIPTPTALPVNDFEKETNPAIDELIKEYYTAKKNSDLKSLKKLYSNPSVADSQDELQKKTEYIDEYLNIKTYIKKGFKEGTFIVYAYSEVKFTGIKTPAPGLAKFFIITDKNNKLKFFCTDDMDEVTKNYFDERNSDQDVIDLINITEKKSDKAIKSDEDLLNFWKKLDEMATSSVSGDDSSSKSKSAKAEGDSN